MTSCGFCVVAALSRYTSGLPRTSVWRIGNSSRICSIGYRPLLLCSVIFATSDWGTNLSPGPSQRESGSLRASLVRSRGRNSLDCFAGQEVVGVAAEELGDQVVELLAQGSQFDLVD